MRSNRYYRLVDETPPEVKQQREKLEEDIKTYLAKGGEVQQVPKGYSRYSAQPLRSWVEESRKKKFGD